jgi:hypothetical protein
MSEFLECMTDIYKEVPGQLSLSEDLIVGAADVSLGVFLVSQDKLHDVTSTVIEYALAKPAGLTLGIFGALCLKSAAEKTYKHFRNQ